MNDEEQVDRGFAALADPVRRAIVARLSRGPATVGEVAEPFDISLQAVSRHLRVLEEAGLVSKGRNAQRRPVRLEPAALERLTAWIDGYRLASEQSFRRLDVLLAEAVRDDASDDAGDDAGSLPADPSPASPAESRVGRASAAPTDDAAGPGRATPPPTAGATGRRPDPQE